MKTVNGKNKLERQINKAKKYLGIELVESSNQYLKVKSYDEANTYVVSKEAAKLVKNGELYVIKPQNWNDEIKPLFVKPFATIETDNLIWFKLNPEFVSEEVKNELEEVLKGFDDIFTMKEFYKNSTWIEVRKN